MDEQSGGTKNVIHEFCRSQGAPTGYWLGRLSRDGQRACIRQCIIKSRSPEIYSQTHTVVEQLFEERANENPFFYDALGAEEVAERVERARHHARERLDEQIRYGAISRDEINSPQPWVEYNRYHDICDREWRLMVEGNKRKEMLRYATLAMLLVVATALTFRELYIAMWCAVIGGLVTTFLAFGE
jgi:hypothetical protein